VHKNVEALRRRQEAARTVRPGDRAAALDIQQAGERQGEP